jgi:hypothetical protein
VAPGFCSLGRRLAVFVPEDSPIPGLQPENCMGLDINGVQLLIQARKSGVSFGRVATLGRQGLHANLLGLQSLLRRSGFDLSGPIVQEILSSKSKFADDFLLLLGATEIVAVDFSDYEGAQVIHDMNLPIPENLRSSFDTVLDGGTLEHVFDFPTALRNAIEMVRMNGRFISITETNNFCGHGFYQFSPELFYRFLTPANGYTMESCMVWEDRPGSKFYRVPDPDSVRSRINLTSEVGTYMMVQARRTGDASRSFIPLQSDYVRLWEAPGAVQLPTGFLEKLKSALRRTRILESIAMRIWRLRWLQKWKTRADARRLHIKRSAPRVLSSVQDLIVLH